MACPSCFGMTMIGSKFCSHCGAIAAPLEVALNETTVDCPRCRKRMEEINVTGTTMNTCTRCDGVWVDADVFEHICADREKSSAVLNFFNKRTLKADSLTKINYVPCPECGQLMNRNNFAKVSGVIVDICKQHGVWFDLDELPAIIEFISKGGMEMSRKKDLLEIKEERDKLREERRSAAAGAHDLGETTLFNEGHETGIRSFVKSLFD